MATHREDAERLLAAAKGARDSNELAFLRCILLASVAQTEAQLAQLDVLEEIAQALKSR